MMGTVQKIGVIIAITGLATTLVMSGRQTANITKTGFAGLASVMKVAQGRG